MGVSDCNEGGRKRDKLIDKECEYNVFYDSMTKLVTTGEFTIKKGEFKESLRNI